MPAPLPTVKNGPSHLLIYMRLSGALMPRPRRFSIDSV